MEMKNISRQSLNINPSELMERFKRGDESRSTEGSGLGLAIAKDLMKLMKGRIDILIDGDLFKVKLILAAASEDEPTAVDLGKRKNGAGGTCRGAVSRKRDGYGDRKSGAGAGRREIRRYVDNKIPS